MTLPKFHQKNKLICNNQYQNSTQSNLYTIKIITHALLHCKVQFAHTRIHCTTYFHRDVGPLQYVISGEGCSSSKNSKFKPLAYIFPLMSSWFCIRCKYFTMKIWIIWTFGTVIKTKVVNTVYANISAYRYFHGFKYQWQFREVLN